jgi:hypothetical protein
LQELIGQLQGVVDLIEGGEGKRRGQSGSLLEGIQGIAGQLQGVSDHLPAVIGQIQGAIGGPNPPNASDSPQSSTGDNPQSSAGQSPGEQGGGSQDDESGQKPENNQPAQDVQKMLDQIQSGQGGQQPTGLTPEIADQLRTILEQLQQQ